MKFQLFRKLLFAWLLLLPYPTTIHFFKGGMDGGRMTIFEVYIVFILNVLDRNLWIEGIAVFLLHLAGALCISWILTRTSSAT